MKKSVFVLLLACMPFGNAMAQETDPVVMTIGGKDVPRSEFEYFFNKNNDSKDGDAAKTVESYADMFINYKLKVLAALDAHLDTLASFKKEFANYRDIQLRDYLKDPEFEDSLALSVYNVMKQQAGDADMIHVAHIMMLLPQKATESVRLQKKARIDSVYAALKNGADFGELAKKCSEDYTTASKGGDLPWIAPKQTLPEFEKEAYALKPGEYSKPFLTPVGYHIVYMIERKKLEPFEEKKEEIMQLLKSRGLKEIAAEHKIKRMIEASHGQKTREEIISQVQAEACKKDPNLKFLIEEYHDGLLLYEVSNRLVWQQAAEDKAGLEKYFKKNKSKYQWDSERFKGFVILSKSETLMDEAEKFLKKQKDESGVEAWTKAIPKDSLKKIRVRYGIFKAGDDAVVDSRVFDKPDSKQNKLYPYSACVGSKLKKPKTYTDVKAQVVSDFQDLKEKEWLEELRKKYSFKVNKDVLSTVNKH